MQARLQMNTAVKNRELFRRPQQKSTENNHKIYPDLSRLAGHEVVSRRQGRGGTNVRNRVITDCMLHTVSNMINVAFP